MRRVLQTQICPKIIGLGSKTKKHAGAMFSFCPGTAILAGSEALAETDAVTEKGEPQQIGGINAY